MTSKRWSSTTKIIVTSLLALLAVILLITFRTMIRPTIVALLLTFILHQPVNWTQARTGWSRGASVAGVYLFLILLLIITPVAFLPRLIESLQSLSTALGTLVESLQSAALGPLIQFGGYELSLDSLFQQMGTLIQDVLSPAAAGALGFALSLTTTVLSTVYVLVLGFWLLKDIHILQRTLLNFVPIEYREDVRRLGLEFSAIWFAFLRGQFVLGMVVGVMTWIAMGIVGQPNAAGFALLAALMIFLPTIGPAISSTIGTLYALFQGSAWLPVNNLVFALIVTGLYSFIDQIVSVYLIPRLVGRRVNLHPAVTFTGVISGMLIFGFLGVLLIIPTIASVRTLLAYVVHKLRDEEPFESGYTQSDVRIPGLIAGHRIHAIIFDLDGVLTELDFSLADQFSDRLRWTDRFWPAELRRRNLRRLLLKMEGLVNWWISILLWVQLYDDLERMTGFLNRARAFPAADQLTVRSGVLEMLSELSHTYQLGLLTARPRAEVDCFLKKAGLPVTLFGVIAAQDDPRSSTSPSESFAQSVKALGVTASEVLMVGDSEWKLRPAQASGAVRCAVLSPQTVESDFAGADLTISNVTELREWL
ncbi:MAG: AI-2E family transporter [Chloroflexi bacterium]|nr:MAG: AI-2E family transporter [Chloroflexota bacterium]